MSEVTITITPEMRVKLMHSETLTVELPEDGWHPASQTPEPARRRVIGYDSIQKEQVFAYQEDSGTWMAWQQTTLDEGWNECPGLTHWRDMVQNPEGCAA